MDLTTMPKIPSAAELSMGGAQWGRGTDTRTAHLSNGEHIVPAEVIAAHPHLQKQIAAAIASMGDDPSSFVVGSPTVRINPNTGQPEFKFNPFKKVKKFVKKVAGSTIGKIVITAAGAMVGGPAGAALANAAATKVSGGSWGQSIGAGVGTYLGSSVGSSLFGTAGSAPASGIGPIMPATEGLIGSAGTVGGYSTVGNLLGSTASSYLPSSIANASLATAIGSAVGSSYGSSIGSALIDGVQQPTTGAWGSESYNDTASLPTSSIQLATPSSSDNSTDSGGTAGTGGAGINQDPGGVTYLSTNKDRNTGATSYTPNASFSNSMAARRGGWGGTFANY